MEYGKLGTCGLCMRLQTDKPWDRDAAAAFVRFAFEAKHYFTWLYGSNAVRDLAFFSDLSDDSIDMFAYTFFMLSRHDFVDQLNARSLAGDGVLVEAIYIPVTGELGFYLCTEETVLALLEDASDLLNWREACEVVF